MKIYIFKILFLIYHYKITLKKIYQNFKKQFQFLSEKKINLHNLYNLDVYILIYCLL